VIRPLARDDGWVGCRGYHGTGRQLNCMQLSLTVNFQPLMSEQEGAGDAPYRAGA
jgi:hypothetical protein